MSQNEVEMYGVYGIQKPVLSASVFKKAAELGGPPGSFNSPLSCRAISETLMETGDKKVHF